MTDPIATVLSALIGGLLVVFGQWLVARLSKRKTGSEAKKLEADAAETVSQAALSLVEPLTKKVEGLEKNVQDLTNRVQVLEMALAEAETELCEKEDALLEAERKIDALTSGSILLADQVVSLGAEPVYKPPERRSQ